MLCNHSKRWVVVGLGVHYLSKMSDCSSPVKRTLKSMHAHAFTLNTNPPYLLPSNVRSPKKAVDGANTYMFSPVCDVWLYKVALGKYYICWTTQQVTVQSKFRVILRIWFDVITTMIVQNTILITNFFRIESFGGRKKKNLLNRAAGNSAQQIQSYPSDMVRHWKFW